MTEESDFKREIQRCVLRYIRDSPDVDDATKRYVDDALRNRNSREFQKAVDAMVDVNTDLIRQHLEKAAGSRE